MRNIRYVSTFLIFTFVFFSSIEELQAARLCYIKKGIEDGSLSIRAGQSNGSDEVALLHEWTPVKCERSRDWYAIKGKDKDGNPKEFYFYDNGDFFEAEDFVLPVKVNPDTTKEVSVFNMTGQNTKSCTMNPYNPETKTGCQALSWPDENSKIEIIDSKIDWNLESNEYEVYYQVRSQYDRDYIAADKTIKTSHNDAIGWVRARELVFGDQVPKPKPVVVAPAPVAPKPVDVVPKPEPVEPIVTVEKPESTTPPYCPPEPIKSRWAIQAVTDANLEKQISTSFNILKTSLGKCLLTPEGGPTTRSVGTGENKRLMKVEPNMKMPKSNGYKYPFDNYLMAGHWDLYQDKDKTFPIPNETQKPIGLNKMIAVDALARTIYGEMASCSYKPDWDKYLQAVARISLNRTSAINSKDKVVRTEARARFIRDDEDEKFLEIKDDMTRVVSEPSSYSVWNPTSDPNPSNLKQVLCPPAQRNPRMYDGSDMTKLDGNDFQQRAIWEHALRYATEAVLFPKAHEMRTDGLTANFYTSNLKMDGGALIRDASMNGFNNFDRYCIQMWTEKGTKL